MARARPRRGHGDLDGVGTLTGPRSLQPRGPQLGDGDVITHRGDLLGQCRRAALMPDDDRSAFRPDQTCAGQPAGAACWMEISGRSGCYVWNPSLQLGATVTWTAACGDNLAQAR